MTPLESTSPESFSWWDYISLSHVRDISDGILNDYDWYFREKNIYRFDFEAFLEDFLTQNNISENDISAHKQEADTIFLKLKNGEELSFTLSEVQNFLTSESLWGISIEDHESKMQNILDATESIYHDNEGIFFNGEIDSDDTVQSEDFWPELQGKTLQQLREIYDEEKQTLILAQRTQEKSHINREILQREIELFAGIGDTFEGWARYFSLSSEEIGFRISQIISQMSNEEIFFYIRDINSKINDNWRKSDMVNQVNGKLTQALYEQTFLRLQEQNAPERDFLTFAKVITGRSIETVRKWNRFEEVESSLDSNYAGYEIANRALIHIMYRDGWVLDTIYAQNIDIAQNISDPEVWQESPKNIISRTLEQIDSLNPQEAEYWKSILIEAGYEHLLSSSEEYKDLSFEDKIAIWALKRIGDILVAATPEQRNPQFLGEKLGDTLMESYSNLNDSFWDAFDWFHGYFWGKNAEDLGLTGTFGEIFDLYQDINGNSWFFDWSDINQDRFLNLSTIMVLWVGIIVWAIVFSPVIAAGTTATAGMMLTAGATAGFATWLTSLMLSRQGYDTYEEWVLDM